MGHSQPEKAWMYLFLAWFLSLAGTLGSLFFSDVMRLPPCSLCWYQRIALYPLVIILAVGYYRRDTKVLHYALPLVLLGLLTAMFHNLLYYGIIPEGISPCTDGVSCKSVQFEAFGFVTIPLLALMGFASVAICLVEFGRKIRR